MSLKYGIMVFFLFMIAAVSDIILNKLSFLPNTTITLKSLRPYYRKYGSIIAPVLASITILVAFFINTILFKLLFSTFLPTTRMHTVWFIIMAIIIGITADIVIDRYHIFGNSLNEYYSISLSYMWGFLSYLFALFGSWIGYKLVIGFIR